MKRLLVCGWLLLAFPAWSAMPSFDAVRDAWRPSDAYLLDRNGRLLQQLRMDRKVRRLWWTPLDQVSPALLRALIWAEDRRFHTHAGVDWRAVAAALGQRLRGGARRGASTLSMQLAALLDPALTPRLRHRSWPQKFRQIRDAYELEKRWTKRQILEAYLNLVDFRGELQGIAAAAKGLFDKAPSGLNEAEAVLLAAALPSPNGASQHLARKACAIAHSGGFEVSCAALRELAGSLDGGHRIAFSSGSAPHLAVRLLKGAGDSVASTLDADLQQRVVDALTHQLRGLVGRNVRDGAAIVVANQTGDVLAYVGSAGPYSRSPQVDGARARRQAGSTLKPFLYGLALERRYLTAASLLADTPVNLETTSGLYIPQNYDHEFKGMVSVRTALAGSLNVPAVRTLALAGVRRFRDRLVDLGYSGITEDGDYYGFSLALGSAEVNLVEQVGAYRSLANGGMWSPLRWVPEDGSGSGRRVMPEQASFIIADILADDASRAVTFGFGNPLKTRYWTAVKTGTSKEMRDNWCIGFSRKYTVGVWVGNFEGDAMQGVSGVTGAAPVWLSIMDELHAGDPASSSAPAPPAGLVLRQVQFDPALEAPRREWFVPGTETALIRLNAAEHRAPRITSPPNGVVIALDPDVPPDRQMVIFIARAARPNHAFLLNGHRIASGRQRYKWQPRPGSHRLALVDPVGKVLDAVDFSVRRVRERAN